MSEIKKGQCHCGAVEFQKELENSLEDIRRCNCSLCRRKGAIIASVAVEKLKVTKGEGNLSLYQWNTKTANHFFCKTCGIYTHHQRRSDIQKTKDFYDKTLAPIGYELGFDKNFGETRVLGYSKNGKVDTWFTNDRPVSGPVHIAWKVDSQNEVDDFYKAAIGPGGKDNGKPGKREIYHPNYYGAFILDPDGNNVEAVFHGAE